MKSYVEPLIEIGALNLTIPDKPKSRNQKYYSNDNIFNVIRKSGKK
jgi:hypothetical protein